MNKSFTLNYIWVMSALLIAGLLSLYVFQVVSITQNTFLGRDFQKRVSELSDINKSLEINFSQMNILKNIEKVAVELSFEKPQKVHYIRVLEGSVATK